MNDTELTYQVMFGENLKKGNTKGQKTELTLFPVKKL